jgi:hypothetical protein
MRSFQMSSSPVEIKGGGPKKFCSKTLEGRDHLADLDVESSIILRWILRKYYMKLWTGCIWFRMECSAEIL